MRMLVTVIITVAVLSGSFFVLYNLEHFKQGALANNKGSKDGFAISIILPIVLSIPTYALNFLIKSTSLFIQFYLITCQVIGREI